MFNIRDRRQFVWAVAATAACLLSWTAVGAQSGEPAVASDAGISRALARTPDGHPDLQGVWTHGTRTPFERPVALGDKAFYTPEELADLERRPPPSSNQNARPGDVGGDNEAFVDTGYTYLRTRQTSIVVDPPNGRLPFRPDVEKTRQFNTTNEADFETMSPWDRCITRSPMLMLPAGYDNGTRIVQTPGYVVIEAEMVHEARIIPTDGTPHPPASVRAWTGDPRGHWEGDTLVIDSTNYTDKGWLSTHAGSGRLRGSPNSLALHVVERLTPIDGNTIAYRVTVDDPAVFTSPWTASFLLNRSPDYQMFEYACHEGNTAIELALRGARAQEKR